MTDEKLVAKTKHGELTLDQLAEVQPGMARVMKEIHRSSVRNDCGVTCTLPLLRLASEPPRLALEPVPSRAKNRLAVSADGAPTKILVPANWRRVDGEEPVRLPPPEIERKSPATA